MAIIFSKKLTKTDTEYRCSIKSSSFIAFPGFENGNHVQVLKVEDEEEKQWLFHLNIRKGRYKKPVLSGGWLKFIVTKKLEIGDEILFFKDEDEATGVKYKIRVKKPVKLFKAVIGYVPYYHHVN